MRNRSIMLPKTPLAGVLLVGVMPSMLPRLSLLPPTALPLPKLPKLRAPPLSWDPLRNRGSCGAGNPPMNPFAAGSGSSFPLTTICCFFCCWSADCAHLGGRSHDERRG